MIKLEWVKTEIAGACNLCDYPGHDWFTDTDNKGVVAWIVIGRRDETNETGYNVRIRVCRECLRKLRKEIKAFLCKESNNTVLRRLATTKNC